MNQKKPKQNHQKGKATARVSREDYYYNVRTKKFQSQGKQIFLNSRFGPPNQIIVATFSTAWNYFKAHS